MADELDDATNPSIDFLAATDSRYANTYRLQKLDNGMVALIFGINDGETEYILSTFAVVMTEQNAASVGGSLLSLLDKE